jgi:hypothetical protein
MEVDAQTHLRAPLAATTSRSSAGAIAPAAAELSAAVEAPSTDPALPSPRSFADYVLAWVDAHRLKLFVAVAALYLLGFNGQWRLDADSALYLSIGRNLAEGRGYTYHGQSHSLAYPGMPWLFAGLFKVFGTDTLVPADMAMLLCSVAALGLVYRLFLLHAGRPTAVLMTVALALSRTFFRYSFELLSDMPFLMGVMAFLVGYESVFHRRYDRDVTESLPSARAKPRWYDAVLLLAGLAVAMVTRPTMWALLAAVVVSVVLSLFTRPLRRGWVILGIGFVAAALTAGVLFYALDPRRGKAEHAAGDYERAFVDKLMTQPREIARKMLRQNLPEILHPGAAEAVFGVDWGHLDTARRYLPLGVVPSLISIAAGVMLIRRRLLWGTWVALSVLTMLVTLTEVRYFLQVLPLLLYGWWVMLVWIDRRIARRRWLNLLPMTVFILLVAVNAGRCIYLMVEQRSSPFLEGYRRGKYALVPELTQLLQSHTPPEAWVLVPERPLGRILTFTSGRYAVEPGPLTQLNPETQTVYVLEPLEQDVLEWMRILQLGTGEPVGPPVRGRRRKEWQLHKAVKVRPEPPALGAAGTSPP